MKEKTTEQSAAIEFLRALTGGKVRAEGETYHVKNCKTRYRDCEVELIPCEKVTAK